MQYFQSNKNVNARRKPTSEKWVTVDYSTASHVCMNADVITNPESRCKCIMVFHAYLTLFLPSPPLFRPTVSAHTSAAAPEQHLAYD